MGRLVAGFKYFLNGFSLIWKPGIKRYVFIPLLINIAVFSVAIYYLINSYDGLVALFTPELNWMPEWLRKVVLASIGLLKIVFTIVILIAVFFTFTALANIISAPFNSYLAAAVERHVTGQPNVEHQESIVKAIARSLWGLLSMLLYMLLWFIVWVICLFIPGLNFLCPFGAKLFFAWMFTLSALDPALANRGFIFPEIRRIARKKIVMCWSFGAIAIACTLIPGLNLMVIPVSVAGATKMMVEEFNERKTA